MNLGKETFQNIDYWLDQFRKVKNEGLVFIVGNKIDLINSN
jgi:GTPase SAR1 family protein